MVGDPHVKTSLPLNLSSFLGIGREICTLLTNLSNVFGLAGIVNVTAEKGVKEHKVTG